MLKRLEVRVQWRQMCWIVGIAVVIAHLVEYTKTVALAAVSYIPAIRPGVGIHLLEFIFE